MSGKAPYTPKWARTQVVQNPPPGPFSVHELNWVEICDNSKHHTVACFPTVRFQDFVDGKSVRGETVLLSEDAGKGRHKIDENCACCYGKEKRKQMQDRYSGCQAWDQMGPRHGTKAWMGEHVRYAWQQHWLCKSPGYAPACVAHSATPSVLRTHSPASQPVANNRR